MVRRSCQKARAQYWQSKLPYRSFLVRGFMTDQLSFSVIFVHGLRGDAFDTWTSGTVCWPRELLAKELKNSRIISVSQDFTEPSEAILILN
jgi:hypothetical protein